MNKHIIAVILTFVCVCTRYVYCDDKIKVMSVEELRKIQIDFGFKENYLLIDIASSEVYKREHIAGAINIPELEIKIRAQEFPSDKMLITYCHCGADSSSARRAAEELGRMGFSNISYLGMPANAYNEYKHKHYDIVYDTPIYAARYMTENIHPVSSVSAETLYSRIYKKGTSIDKNFIILDVRMKTEYDNGHIPLSFNIPLPNLEDEYKRLPYDKDIYIYGNEDWNASVAVNYLVNKGYRKVYIIEGDFPAWELTIIKMRGMEKE